MATEQDKITIYVPRNEGDEFRALIKSEDKTMTAVMRRLMREYVAASKVAA